MQYSSNSNCPYYKCSSWDKRDATLKFIKACDIADSDVSSFYNAKLVDINAYDDLAFRTACSSGNLDAAKFIISRSKATNVNFDSDLPFRQACYHGKLSVARWLHENHQIDPIASDFYAFRWACMNGHLDVAKWLTNVMDTAGIEVCKHVDLDHIYWWAESNGHDGVASWINDTWK